MRSSLRHTSIGTRLVISFAGVSVLLTLILVVIVNRIATDKVKQEIGHNLSELAFQTTDKLDRGMFERYREVQLMASKDTFADPAVSNAEKRHALDMMRETYPYYAWLGVAGNDGKVIVASSKMLEGVDVSKRPWYANAYHDQHLNDVHEALLLAKLLPNPSNEPKRFFDIAFPYRDKNGSIAGIFGVHLSWSWATEIQQSVLRALDNRRGVDTFILSKDGIVLLGPKPLIGTKLALPSVTASARDNMGYLSEQWPDGRRYLVGYSKSLGYGSYPGFGWTVLVRQAEEQAFAPVALLHKQILIGGASAALVFSLLGALIAHYMAKPLLNIAQAAGRMEHGEAGLIDSGSSGYREIHVLTSALNSLLGKLNINQASLRELNRNLEARVMERTSELANAVETLQSNEQRTQAILANALDAFVGMDEQGRITDWNLQAEIVFGWKSSEVVGKSVEEIVIPARFRDAHKNGLRRFLATGNATVVGRRMELNALRRDGQEFPVEMTIGLVRTAHGTFFSAFMNDISERKRVADELAKNSELLTAVLETIDVAVIACDEDAHLTVFNRAAKEWHGLPADDISPDEWSAHYNLYHADGRTPIETRDIPLMRALVGEVVHDDEMRILPRDGQARILLASGRPLFDTSKRKLGAVAVMKDVTERKRTETALAESRERLQTITDNMPALIAYVDKSEQYQFANKTMEAWHRRPRNAIYGRSLLDVHGPQNYAVFGPHVAKVLQGDRVVFDDTRIINGVKYYLEVTCIPHWNQMGEVVGFYVMAHDVTERKNEEMRFAHYATHDALTGLPNRRACLERLSQAIDRVARAEKPLAVFFLDLDGFKRVNDTYGHEMGDKVLIAFAERLSKAVRKTDVVARLAGDEFIIIAEGLTDGHKDAAHIADKVIASLSTPVVFGDTTVFTATSIGIALFAGGDIETEQLLSNADNAMYEAKQAGSNRYVFSNPV